MADERTETTEPTDSVEPDKSVEPETSADSTESSDTESSDTGSAAPPSGGAVTAIAVRGGLWWASIVAAGLLAVLVVVVAVLGYRSYTAHRIDEARSEALSSARSAASDVLSYDYRHLDKDFADAERRLAPPFSNDYAETTKTVVRPKALETKAVVSADVVGASVVSAAEDRVITLLFVNQTTKSSLAEEGRTDLNRVRLTMERIGDEWLVSKIDAL